MTKVAVAIAVVSVAGIVAAGLGFKIGKTQATLKLKSPAASSVVYASEKLDIKWDTNVEGNKGLVDIYITKAGDRLLPENTIWSSLGLDASKKSKSTPKIMGEILNNSVVMGSSQAYTVWVQLRKVGAEAQTANILEEDQDFTVSYGNIISLASTAKDGAEKYWKEKVAYTVKYNFPTTGVMKIYLKKTGDETTQYPKSNSVYDEITKVGENSFSGEIDLSNSTTIPTGEYTLAALWASNVDCIKSTKCVTRQTVYGTKINVSAPITVTSATGGVVKCKSMAGEKGVVKPSAVALAKFSVKNENNVEYWFNKLTVDITAANGTSLSVTDIYLADENGKKIVDADPNLLSIENGTQTLTFSLSDQKIAKNTAEKLQIMGKVSSFYGIANSVTVKIKEFLAGKNNGNKPAVLSPDPVIITPTVDTAGADSITAKHNCN